MAGHWDVPGGFVEAGELPEQAVLRETREETTLEVADLEVLGAWTSLYGASKWTVDIGYRGRLAGGELVLSGEKLEAAWLPLDDFPVPAFAGEREALDLLRRRSRKTT
jgi:ADP-ribose pyrophosphatase YjhB (NUDIX family)